MVDSSTIIPKAVGEEMVAIDPVVTTQAVEPPVVVEAEMKTVEDQATMKIESTDEDINAWTGDLTLQSPRVGDSTTTASSDHHARKEVIEEIPLGPQGEVSFLQ